MIAMSFLLEFHFDQNSQFNEISEKENQFHKCLQNMNVSL